MDCHLSRCRAWWILTVVLNSACVGGSTTDDVVSVRDSVGIRIVENRDVPWSDRNAWSVPAEPVLRLGAEDRDGEAPLHRVAGGVLLDDGRIVVANAGNQEVRWYDPSGTLVAQVGRRGQGPGEFIGLGPVARLPADSVVAYDRRLRRVTVLGPDGTFARVAPLAMAEHAGMEFPALEGALGDGTLLFSGRIMETGEMQAGPVRAAMPLYRVDATGALIDSLHTFHGWEATVIMRRTADVVGPAITARPFGRSTSVTTVGAGLAVGTPLSFEYRLYEPHGALTAIVRLDRRARRLTAGDIDAYEASIEDKVPDEAGRRALREQARDWEYPETFPAYGSDLVGDAAGNLWVPNFTHVPTPPSRWSVFDATGRYLGDVEIPVRVQVLAIGEDRLLGLWRDEFDVEQVHLYDIRKP